jgi:hypothetical protein
MKPHTDRPVMVFLARQLYEADMVAAALEEAGIQQVRKVEGSRAGSLYRILVASEVEAQARSIVATISTDEEATVGKAPSERIERVSPRLRAIAVAVFVVVAVGGFALVILGWLHTLRGH